MNKKKNLVVVEKDEVTEPTGSARIVVFGVGGGGCNVIKRMAESDVGGIEFVAANTDRQSLLGCKAHRKVLLGKSGKGAGGCPETGQRAAEETRELIAQIVNGANMVFVATGMGGGTGSGAANVIAQIAKEAGCLVVGVVTHPFSYEGDKRAEIAQAWTAKLKDHVDSLIVIPNENLLKIINKNMGISETFKIADDVLKQGIQAVTDLITVEGEINIDFADVAVVMRDAGEALMGIGSAKGAGRGLEAANQALVNKLLGDRDISNATGLLVNISAGSNFPFTEVHEVAKYIQGYARKGAEIKMGLLPSSVLNKDDIRITVIATGFTYENAKGHEAVEESREDILSYDEFANGVMSPLSSTPRRSTPKIDYSIPSRIGMRTDRDREIEDHSPKKNLDYKEPAIFRKRFSYNGKNENA